MSIPLRPQPAKLVISILSGEKAILPDVIEECSKSFGNIDYASAWIPFKYTDYYFREMGSPLFKRLVSFKRLVEQEELAEIKLVTNRIESLFTENNCRRVNLDPGILLFERFVLATGKNYCHRIYIGRRIYADLTLVFQGGRFVTLPWTYPDYADDALQKHLLKMREKYKKDLRGRP